MSNHRAPPGSYPLPANPNLGPPDHARGSRSPGIRAAPLPSERGYDLYGRDSPPRSGSHRDGYAPPRGRHEIPPPRIREASWEREGPRPREREFPRRDLDPEPEWDRRRGDEYRHFDGPAYDEYGEFEFSTYLTCRPFETASFALAVWTSW
jgi:hypothetical protein